MSITFTSITQLGKAIPFHRKRAGLTRAELSELAGVGQTTIYELEHGKESIQFNMVFHILDVLNISLQVDSPLMNEYPARKHPTGINALQDNPVEANPHE